MHIVFWKLLEPQTFQFYDYRMRETNAFQQNTKYQWQLFFVANVIFVFPFNLNYRISISNFNFIKRNRSKRSIWQINHLDDLLLTFLFIQQDKKNSDEKSCFFSSTCPGAIERPGRVYCLIVYVPAIQCCTEKRMCWRLKRRCNGNRPRRVGAPLQRLSIARMQRPTGPLDSDQNFGRTCP